MTQPNGVAQPRHPTNPENIMRITFFPASAIGYLEYPEALFTRGLAQGLAAQGADIRIVEERKNPAVRRTLAEVGSDAFRRVHQKFPNVPVHGFEPRTGAKLMEWLSRELSLIDVAVAVNGLPDELCRWIANLDHESLTRVYMTFRPEELTSDRAEQLELERFDMIACVTAPEADVRWQLIAPTLAPADGELINDVPDDLRERLVSPAVGADQFRQLLAGHSTQP